MKLKDISFAKDSFSCIALKKTMLTMKLLILLFTATALQVSATEGYGQNVSLSERKTSILNVLKKIEKQTGYFFWYEDKLLKEVPPISVNVKNEPLSQTLDICFENAAISYEIINKTILLKRSSISGTKQTTGSRTLVIKSAIKTIAGIVTDSTGAPISGVSILIKGTSTGTTTNAEGRFTIDASSGNVLVFSYVGYRMKEVVISNTSAVLNIVLEAQSEDMEILVITALGIKRAEKSLTYNVQQVSGNELTRNKDANFVNALNGKVAGVTINASSAGIGGATRVIMRGTKSINASASNNVLYVIDGMPMPNANGGQTKGPFEGAVSGEGISSINPEDIESISALTGPSAAALYGSGATNGVILVTTRKGSVGKMRIDFSHSSDFFKPFVMPQFQNTYGQSSTGAFDSWGAKLDKPSSYRPKDFFQTGTNIFNTISFSGGTEKSQTFFSIGTNNANGIIPNNTFNRYNTYLRHTTNLTDRLTADFNAAYINLNDRNLIAQGQYNNPLLGVYLFPPGEDFEKFKIYKRYDPNHKYDVQYWPLGDDGLTIENPYWIIYNEPFTNKTDRYMLSGSAKYEVFRWMDITGRVRADNSYTISEIKRAATTNGTLASNLGYYEMRKTNSKNTYIDLIAAMKHKLSSDIGFKANIGGSYLNDNTDALKVGGKLQRLANKYSAKENTTDPPDQTFYHRQEQAVFATVDLDYKKWLYLTGTGRQEWSSLLAGANKQTYFYPSAGISVILTDAINISKNVLTYAKIRGSYAEVGKAPPIYGITTPAYSILNSRSSKSLRYRSYKILKG